MTITSRKLAFRWFCNMKESLFYVLGMGRGPNF